MQSSLLFTTQGKHITMQDVVHSIRDDGCGSHNKDDDDNDDYGQQMGSCAFCGDSKRCCCGWGAPCGLRLRSDQVMICDYQVLHSDHELIALSVIVTDSDLGKICKMVILC